MAKQRSRSVGRVDRVMRARQLRRFHHHLQTVQPARPDLLERFTDEVLRDIDLLLDGGEWRDVPEGSEESVFEQNWDKLASLTSQLTHVKRWQAEKEAAAAAAADDGGDANKEQDAAGEQPETTKTAGDRASSATRGGGGGDCSAQHQGQLVKPSAAPQPRDFVKAAVNHTSTPQDDDDDDDDEKLKDAIRVEYHKYRDRYNRIPALYMGWLHAWRNASKKHRVVEATLKNVLAAEAKADSTRSAYFTMAQAQSGNVTKAQVDEAHSEWATAAAIHRSAYEAWDKAKKQLDKAEQDEEEAATAWERDAERRMARQTG
ncbi:hypothetical protein CGRA01v4_15045 [Colletotrichum graminicola]|uniref:Uncharacterized protein n=1 Tax=Colletotrichum graminicola (strain M1.001 / M2 / FGSC 10212) TaxID=645133 RepID=E3R092_COLGM|nr:uncharacterized protein GLRG_11689 [Colletotrichum graminicola M1.001]EFQ36530.1 hypothetical protein GLRG_11689 [Colletotrichum graminicola M1.001]WDK23753.1 hypothetical protein CGRA01v4_15045 [Colletotrichum graminicola]